MHFTLINKFLQNASFFWHLDGAIGWASDSWFWLRLWSQCCEIEPSIRLSAQHGVCLRLSSSPLPLPSPISPPCALLSLSLKKKKKFKFSLKTKGYHSCLSFVSSFYWLRNKQFLWILQFLKRTVKHLRTWSLIFF